MEEVIDELKLLFDEAKQRSEFELVLTLINYRGMGTHKLTTNLHEWFEALDFYKRLYISHTDKEKTRMGALLYSTFFENSDFYNIIGSLCKVKMGYRGSSYLFWKTKKYERVLGIGEKQEFLLELLFDANKHNIVKFFKENYFKEIRNTFFHSAYSLGNDNYILHETEPIYIGGIGQSSFEINGFFYPKINNVISFFESFRDLYLNAFASYKENKVVFGFFPNPSNITILGSNQGLKGFKIEKHVQFFDEWYDAGIWYDEKYDMYVGHNIRFDMPNIESIEINDQIKRYEDKDDIHQSDAEFHNLIEKISERNYPDEIAKATNLLLKFGGLRHQKMLKEENYFKRKSFPKFILPFYRRAIEIGSALFDTTEIKKTIEELEKNN
ncbi:hypothetical protein [Spirosoma agri]|uniref:Uncharacterized protein n=1 Tax=Spirosoma agri TaxID=1987381 RepID=A0A6M0ICH0_9BACT|nr:hypothetical protein [Spirosoma agri]NEU65950.1 hypothetical protein [Spirosoma agri]